MILIDRGSTHNFVKSIIAKKLAMPLTEIKPFKVYVGVGNQLNVVSSMIIYTFMSKGTRFGLTSLY